MKSRNIIDLAVTIGLLLVTLLIVIAVFENLSINNTNLAMDWRSLWRGIKDGVPHYGTGLRVPPWGILVILPLGLLSFRTSWGVLTMLTLVILVLSIPRNLKSKFPKIWTVLILILAYPTLRTIADGNLEVLIIAGILVLEDGLLKHRSLELAIGLILTSIKIQETWILLLFFPIYLVNHWPWKDIFKTAGIVALVCIPSLVWQGQEWLGALYSMKQIGSIMDSSLLAAMAHQGVDRMTSYLLWAAIFVTTAVVILRGSRIMTRDQLGVLLAASLLLAPYAAANNFLTIYAISVIPLFMQGTSGGIGLVILTNLLYLMLPWRGWLYNWSAIYWTCVFGVTWGLFVFRVVKAERSTLDIRLV